MTETAHIVEANHHRRPRMFFAEHPEDGIVVVDSDAFNDELDLPSTGEQVTIVCGNEVIRGKVTSIVYLVTVSP